MVSKWGWRIVAQGAAGKKKYVLNYNIFSMEYKGIASEGIIITLVAYLF